MTSQKEIHAALTAAGITADAVVAGHAIIIFASADRPPDPPDPGGRFPFRAIYVRDDEFDACYPEAFQRMELSAMECAIFSGTTNLVKRMDALAEPDMAWSLLGGFTADVDGGTFRIPDTDLATIVESVRDHPRNSHRYYIADEPNLTGMTAAQQDANRDALRARTALIHEVDPLARVSLGDYRREQLDPELSARPGAMWAGVVDEVWLDGYPSPNIDADPERIPDQARWCDQAGVDYLGVISVHEYQGDNPAYPTEAHVQASIDAWAATGALGIVTYIYYDDEGGTHLSDDVPMQEALGRMMAAVA